MSDVHDWNQITDHIWLGNVRAGTNLTQLQKQQIRGIVVCMPELPMPLESYQQAGIQVFHVNLYDHKSQPIEQYFEPAIDFINKFVSQKQNVLIHCHAGISRSTTITLAYLCFMYGLPLNDALTVVRARRWFIKPNSGFLAKLAQFCNSNRVQEKKQEIQSDGTFFSDLFENLMMKQYQQNVPLKFQVARVLGFHSNHMYIF